MIPDCAALQRRARKLLPRDVYDYYAGGSGRERTRRANEKAWQQVWLAPRVLRDVSAIDTTARLLGTEVATPLGVAPTGYHGLAHPDGEVATAAGAARAGALFVLSIRSTRRIEDVADAVAAEGGTWWFQVYLMRDRELTASLVRRAAAAGAAALVLTADTPVVGRKRRNSKDGVVSDEAFVTNLGPLEDLGVAEQAADLTLADIGWLREAGGGLPVVVKGVLTPEDARRAVDSGAAGIVVSNHGGRQLDTVLSGADALPAVVEEAGDELDVLVDGGIRRGTDVLKALALGARAVLIGRPVLWGLAVGGEQGVARVLELLLAEIDTALMLAGAPRAAELDRSWVQRAPWTAIE